MFQDITFVFKSPLRAKIVTYFIRRPSEWGNVTDVVATVGSTRTTVSKELAQLLKFGILISKRVHNTNAYRVNENDALYKPLQEFLATVASPTNKEIIEAFRGIRGVTLIVAGGLFTDEPKSPVEILLVCRSPKDKKIDKAIKKLEALTALPIRYAVLSPQEYYDRRQAYDRMLRDLFEFKHRIVVEKEG